MNTHHDPAPSIGEVRLEHGVRGVELRNAHLSATVLPEHGADIHTLRSVPHDLDLLWKSPWGLQPQGTAEPVTSMDAWFAACGGGWQVITPNGSDACQYKGANLDFHGEASVSWWSATTQREDGRVRLELSTRLRRSPFRLHRTLTLGTGPDLVVEQRIANEGGEPMELVYGEHPTFGPPFLDGSCTLATNAGRVIADDLHSHPDNPLTPGAAYDWPGPAGVDLRRLPAPSERRALLAYLTDFPEEAEYTITNHDRGLAVRLRWDRDALPYVWCWQESRARTGYPFYGHTYAVAVEPFTSWPGQGLTTIQQKTGTQVGLGPDKEFSSKLTVSLADLRGRGAGGQV